MKTEDQPTEPMTLLLTDNPLKDVHSKSHEALHAARPRRLAKDFPSANAVPYRNFVASLSKNLSPSFDMDSPELSSNYNSQGVGNKIRKCTSTGKWLNLIDPALDFSAAKANDDPFSCERSSSQKSFYAKLSKSSMRLIGNGRCALMNSVSKGVLGSKKRRNALNEKLHLKQLMRNNAKKGSEERLSPMHNAFVGTKQSTKRSSLNSPPSLCLMLKCMRQEGNIRFTRNKNNAITNMNRNVELLASYKKHKIGIMKSSNRIPFLLSSPNEKLSSQQSKMSLPKSTLTNTNLSSNSTSVKALSNTKATPPLLFYACEQHVERKETLDRSPSRLEERIKIKLKHRIAKDRRNALLAEVFKLREYLHIQQHEKIELIPKLYSKWSKSDFTCAVPEPSFCLMADFLSSL